MIGDQPNCPHLGARQDPVVGYSEYSSNLPTTSGLALCRRACPGTGGRVSLAATCRPVRKIEYLNAFVPPSGETAKKALVHK
jgi:hypothetical protein